VLGHAAAPLAERVPSCYTDLNLDQVVASLTHGRERYELEGFFHAPLRDAADVAYRHAVFRDLEDHALRERLEAFSAAMRRLREHHARSSAVRNPLQRQRLALDAASLYTDAVTDLDAAFTRGAPASDGLRAVAAYVRAHVTSPPFVALRDDAQRLQRAMAGVTYGLTILEDRVRVARVAGQRDYGEAVERTFARFPRRSDGEGALEAVDRVELNFVEAGILELVARLHPEAFEALGAFASRHTRYVDPVLERFEREAQVYLAYVALMARVRELGVSFCYPEVSGAERDVDVRDAFDLALAETLLEEGGAIVVNDVRLTDPERLLVVTGANQGGKTTFARMVGQLHVLAALGLPVPARAARLPLVERVLTHFEREEDVRTLQGRLHEELTRLHDLLAHVTPRTLVIMNEAFASTAADDALELGRETLERVLALGARGVYVTFIDELSTHDARVVSVTASVDPADPSRRTFEIERRPADGRAHALAVAKAYRLTYDDLRARLRGSA
jgi:DNA mismatch repair protein MutS